MTNTTASFTSLLSNFSLQLQQPEINKKESLDLIESIKKAPDLTSALQLVTNNPNKSPSAFVIAAVLKKESNPSDKQRLFAAVPVTKRDAFHYSSLIASRGIPFNEILRIFKEALERNVANGVVCNGFMAAAAKAGQFEKVPLALSTAIAKNEACAASYTNFIKAASQSGHFTEAATAFTKATDQGGGDLILYHTYIEIADRAGRFDLVETAFKRAITNQIATAETYSLFIKIASEANRFQAAQTAFNQAPDLIKINSIVRQSFALASTKAGHPFLDDRQRPPPLSLDALIEQLSLQMRMALMTDKISRELTQQVYRAPNLLYALEIVTSESRYCPSGFVLSALLEKASSPNKKQQLFASIPINNREAFHYSSYLCSLELPFSEVSLIFREAQKRGYANQVVYNTFLKAAGKAGRFNEVQSAFDTAVKKGFADVITYTSFIDAAGNSGQFKAAKAAFSQGKHLGDASFYNSFIDAAGKNGELKEAQQAFNETFQKNFVDPVSFSCLINAASYAEEFKLAEESFAQAKRLNKIDSAVYNSFLNATAKAGFFEKAKGIFSEAKNKNLANTITYANLIDAAGKAGRLVEAKQTFAQAEQKKLVNVFTYNSLIDAAGRNGDFPLAQTTFKAAILAKIADVITYNNFIGAAGRSGRFSEAKKTFEVSIALGIATSETYNIFICMAGKNDRFAEALAIFDKALAAEIANTETYNSLLTAAAEKPGHFDKAKLIFDEAIAKNFVNPITFGCFISICGANEQFYTAEAASEIALQRKFSNVSIRNALLDAAGKTLNFAKAEKIFNDLVVKNSADLLTYGAFINAASKNGFFPLAEQTFHKALTKGFVNAGLYNTILVAARRTEPLEKGIEIFEDAVSKGFANHITYHIAIDWLVEKTNIVKATDLFHKAEFPEQIQREIATPVIDLHGYSHGSGLIALMLFADECLDQEKETFIVVTGKGCIENNNYLAFRNFLQKFSIEGLSSQIDTQNPGILRYTLNLPLSNGQTKQDSFLAKLRESLSIASETATSEAPEEMETESLPKNHKRKRRHKSNHQTISIPARTNPDLPKIPESLPERLEPKTEQASNRFRLLIHIITREIEQGLSNPRYVIDSIWNLPRYGFTQFVKFFKKP